MENKRVAVIGFGLTGKAVVGFLLKKRALITVFDEKDSPQFENLKSLKKKGVRFSFGPFNFEEIARADLVVISPGISIFKYPQFVKLGAISEIELAFRFFKGKLVCITGTNGKSTTATLTHHLFTRGGRKSYLSGNIGIPFIKDVEKIREDEYAVVEVSCFQLEEIESFKPDYTILTNISQDHLDRYPSMELYLKTRKNIFKNLLPEDKVILNFDDPIIRKDFSVLSDAEVHWFSRKSEIEGTFLRGNSFIFRNKGREHHFFDLMDLPLLGIHNIENALAASLPPLLEGIEMGSLRRGLKDFKGLAHRMEFVTRVGGVDFINDSKATNVDAVLKALMSIREENLVIIMGGRYKGGDFSLLSPLLRAKVSLIVLMGEANAIIREQIGSDLPIEKVSDMREAVKLSFNRAGPKGIVLLSPGCASFDMFDSFEHRGEVFKKEVKRLF